MNIILSPPRNTSLDARFGAYTDAERNRIWERDPLARAIWISSSKLGVDDALVVAAHVQHYLAQRGIDILV